MVTSGNLLIVEGWSDSDFHSGVIRYLNLDAVVKVCLPQDVGGNFNNKQGLFNVLPALLNQMADGSISRVAAIVDADYEIEHGLGYKKTVDKVIEIVGNFGFRIGEKARGQMGGLVFKNEDGLKDFGLWVMPGNLSDGMFEDWLKTCVASDESILLKQAEKAVSALQAPKFKPFHQAKAEIATWLAWQRIPGRMPDSAFGQNLLDGKSASFVQFDQWLQQIFPKKT